MEKKNKLLGGDKLKGQIKFLRSQEDLQTRLQKAHDITEETASQFLKPVKYMNDLIGRIPIVGGLLTKMIPIDDWEDSIKNKIGERVKEAFNSFLIVLVKFNFIISFFSSTDHNPLPSFKLDNIQTI